MKVRIARHTVAITLGEHKSIGLDNLLLIDNREGTCIDYEVVSFGSVRYNQLVSE